MGPAALVQFMCFVSAEQTAERSVKNCSCAAVDLWSCQRDPECVVVSRLSIFIDFCDISGSNHSTYSNSMFIVL